ncbi:MAG: Spy/CpxP family protein refolding chaperone [Pyrinomonadaceae bacterium]
MSFGRKLTSTLTLALALAMLSVFTYAQDSSQPKRPDRPDAMRKDGPGDKRGMRRMRGKQGRKGMRGRQGQRGRRGGMGMAFRDLNLSDSQKLQVQKLMETQRENGKAKSEEMRKLMMAQRSGLLTEAQKAQIETYRNQRKADAEKFHQSFLGILNAEQKQKVEARKAEREKRMQEMKTRMEERKKRFEERRKERTEKSNSQEDN